ncbi:MAG: hypothetical protein M1318_03515 [Firmicutes bacterium]|nr:hypothetical protein [Bacillota bacterium]
MRCDSTLDPTRRMRNRFFDHLAKIYRKPYFWHRAGVSGEPTLDTVKRLVAAQRGQA